VPSRSNEFTMADDAAVVAGFGPVGAVSALALAQAGHDVVVVEADPQLRTDPSESRASTFHPPTLEMLADLGIYDELFATGLVAPTYQMRDRVEGVIAHFDLALLAEDTRYPFRLQSEQQNLVAIIERRLRELPNVRLLWGSPITGVRRAGERTVLELGGEEVGSIDGRWVIAADGSNSAARRTLDIDFPGLTYPEQFLVISTEYPMETALPGIASVNYVSDANEWFVLLQTPRHWRALFPVSAEEAARIDDHTGNQARMQGIAKIEGDYPISHVTLYNVHQRVAATFRIGGLLLAGDAGHINNPLGGMGMNSGIHDAIAAVSAIRQAIGGDVAALDRYDAVRREAALNVVQKATHRNWEQLQERDPQVRAARNAAMRATAADPVTARQYLLGSAMLVPRPTPVG